MTIRKTAICAAALTLGFSANLAADISDEAFEAMQAQLQALSQRLDELERSNEALKQENANLRQSGAQTADAVATISEQTEVMAKQVSDASRASSWADRIKLKGDFRFRHESIDEEFKDTRKRDRIRARAAIIAAVNDDVEVGLGIASGSNDPTSSNQTLGDGGSTKGLNLDLAYFKWSGMENTTIVGGKHKNVLYKAGKGGLLWDGDWNPEGFGLSWAEGDYFANAMGTWLESDSKKETELSYGIQAGFEKKLGNGLSLTSGVGFYQIGTQGKGTFYGDADDFFGNSYDPETMTYLYDYNIVELFAELDFELAGRPATVFADFVSNRDAPEFDRGYAFGFSYGSAKNPGEWQFGYTYQEIEADAVFGLLTDSDFGGGGADTSGHVLRGGYAIARNWNLNVTYLLNEFGNNAGNERDYDRLQLDIGFKY